MVVDAERRAEPRDQRRFILVGERAAAPGRSGPLIGQVLLPGGLQGYRKFCRASVGGRFESTEIGKHASGREAVDIDRLLGIALHSRVFRPAREGDQKACIILERIIVGLSQHAPALQAQYRIAAGRIGQAGAFILPAGLFADIVGCDAGGRA